MKRSPRIALVHDSTTAERDYVNGHLVTSEAIPISAVHIVRHILSQVGLNDTHIVTTKQLEAALITDHFSCFDCAFNLASGIPSRYRYAQTPLVLECLRIPYSGNDPYANLLCRDKYRLKSIATSLKIPTPPAIFVDEHNVSHLKGLSRRFFPGIVKPNSLGGSIGINSEILTDKNSAIKFIRGSLPFYSDGLLLERFIFGIEATVLVFGHGNDLECFALGMAKADGTSLPNDFIWDYSAKTGHSPAPFSWTPLENLVSKDVVAACIAYASILVTKLRLRDFNRVDFRIDRDEIVHLLECNAQPNLSPTSSYIRSLNSHLQEINGVQRRYVTSTLRRIKSPSVHKEAQM